MFDNINLFLANHPAFRGKERVVRASACDAIKEVCDIVVEPSEVRIQGHTLFISLRPAAKMLVLQHKQEILTALTLLHKENTPRDIR